MPDEHDNPTKPAVLLLQSSLWQTGYEQGVDDTLRELLKDPAATMERAKKLAASKTYDTAAMAAALRRHPPQTPQQKAARTQELKRMLRDEEQAGVFAALVRSGLTTEEAREKMQIGAVRAKRLRAIAVKLKWIRPRQRKAGVIP